ncbi:MAG: hypothetical protein D6762_07055 [Candidatus Neomarinimicrobiota bacterium]|nr:MAG: hypothetical protein D6762_07055 [Candidatus Neomarinimicrobiota bacterium]
MSTKLNRFERYVSSNLGYGSSAFTYKELLLFTEKLLAQLVKKVPLPEALEIVFESTGNRVQRMVLFSISSAVNSGTPLSQAMLTFKDVFPNFYIAMIMAVERSGYFIRGLEAMVLHLRNEKRMFDYVNVVWFYLRFIGYFVLGGILFFLFRTGLVSTDLYSVAFTIAGTAFVILLVSWFGRFLARKERRKESIIKHIPLAGSLHNWSVVSRYCFLFNVFHRSGVPVHQINNLLIHYLNEGYIVDDIRKINDLIKSKADPDHIPNIFEVIPKTLAREIMLYHVEKTKFDSIQKYSQYVTTEIDELAERILKMEKQALSAAVLVIGLMVYFSLIY